MKTLMLLAGHVRLRPPAPKGARQQRAHEPRRLHATYAGLPTRPRIRLPGDAGTVREGVLEILQHYVLCLPSECFGYTAA